MKKINEQKEVENLTVKQEAKSLHKILFFAPLTLLVLILAAGGWAYFNYANAAYVNGRPVSRLEYIKSMESQGGKQVLERMIEETLIEDEASKKGVSVSQAEIDTEMSNIETRLKSQNTTLDQALEAQGMTKDDLIGQIRSQKLVEKMVEMPTEASQAEIDKFVADTKEQFPKGTTKEEMEETAKTQILSQLQNEAMQKWFNEVKSSAKIIYK